MSTRSKPWEEKYPNLDATAASLLQELQYERKKRLATEGVLNGKLSGPERTLMAKLARVLESPLEDYLRPKYPKWEDVLRETLLKLCRSFDQYNPLQAAMPWIYSIADNSRKDHLRDDERHAGRRRRRGKRQNKAAEDEAGGAGEVDEAEQERLAARIEWDEPKVQPEDRESRETSPGAGLEQREQLAKIRALIKELPKRERKILRRSMKEHYKQIAKLLGTTVPAVTSSVSRSRNKVINGMGEDLRGYVKRLRERRLKKRSRRQRRDQAASASRPEPEGHGSVERVEPQTKEQFPIIQQRGQE